MTLPQRKYYTIDSVMKLCDLLEVMSTRESWELHEIATALKQPKTSIHHVLLTLRDKGFVIQEQKRGRYALSFKPFSLGSRCLDRLPMLKVAKPIMMELLDTLGETINLMIPWQDRVLLVAKCVSEHPLRQDLGIGSDYSLTGCASGRVCLAHFPRDIQVDVLNQLGSKSKPLSLRLEHIRHEGFEEDNELQFEGIRCLAVPLLNVSNLACAALSVSVPVNRFPSLRETIVTELKKSSHEISLALTRNSSSFLTT